MNGWQIVVIIGVLALLLAASLAFTTLEKHIECRRYEAEVDLQKSRHQLETARIPRTIFGTPMTERSREGAAE